MKLRPEQLPSALTQTLAPIYWVAGQEPFQVMEACDQIRAAAKQQGFIEREIISIDNASFDWQSVLFAGSALSLFSEKKLLDIRLPSGKPGKQGSKVLQAYAKQPPHDKLLLIQAAKTDSASKKTAWFKGIDQVGVTVQVWALSPAQTLAWVAKRMRDKGLRPEQQAVQLLTERVEGNLLAAAQEIDKLVLLFGQQAIDEQHVLAAVSDSSRFSVFDLTDAILLGDGKRVQHIVQTLEQEGVDVPKVLWAITDLSRQLFAYVQGVNPQRRLPPNRQKLLQQAKQRGQRLPWQMIWQQLAELDRKSKGVGFATHRQPHRLWCEIEQTALLLAGFNDLLALAHPTQ
ncbi:MAG: DNA polymerase III subunit delta [bacterium]